MRGDLPRCGASTIGMCIAPPVSMSNYQTPMEPGSKGGKPEHAERDYEHEQETSGKAPMSRVGRGLHKASAGMRHRVPEEGRIHDAAEAIACRLDRAGS